MDPTNTSPFNSPRGFDAPLEEKRNFFEKINSKKENFKIGPNEEKVKTVRKTINDNLRKSISAPEVNETTKTIKANKITASSSFESRSARLNTIETIVTDLLSDPSNEPVEDWDQIEEGLIDLPNELEELPYIEQSTNLSASSDANYLDNKMHLIKSNSLFNRSERKSLIKTVARKMIAHSAKLNAELANNPPNPLKYQESKPLADLGIYHKQLESLFFNALFSASKSERDAVCQFFIKVAMEAYKKNDFNTVFGIMVNFERHFMDKFVGDLKSTHSKEFLMLKKLFSPQNNYPNYYSKINELNKTHTPFLHSRNIIMRAMEFMTQPLNSMKMNTPDEMRKEIQKNNVKILELRSEDKEQEAEKLSERNKVLEEEISSYDSKRAYITKDIDLQSAELMAFMVVGTTHLTRDKEIARHLQDNDLFQGVLAKPLSEDDIYDKYVESRSS